MNNSKLRIIIIYFSLFDSYLLHTTLIVILFISREFKRILFDNYLLQYNIIIIK